METDGPQAAPATGSLGQEESPSRNLLRRRIVTDASCRVVDRKDYEPYGVEIRPATNAAGNTHQYTGHERDAATGLDYMHYRYHAANLGRFMKPDNVPGDLTTPQSWNLYAYALGSPVNLTDPTGHMVGQAWRGYTWASGDIAGAMGNHQQANGLGGGIGLGSHGLNAGFGPGFDSWFGLAALVSSRRYALAQLPVEGGAGKTESSTMAAPLTADISSSNLFGDFSLTLYPQFQGQIVPQDPTNPLRPLYENEQFRSMSDSAFVRTGNGTERGGLAEAGFTVRYFGGNSLYFTPIVDSVHSSGPPNQLSLSIDLWTIAILHTHGNRARSTPGPGDFTGVPDFVRSASHLYMTIPGKRQYIELPAP
ncbi:MAG: RHS repeat-associated core domain-containing protein [Bacillota bacterium]